MMKKLRSILMKGGTLKDILKEIPDFEATVEFLMASGYKKSTAMNYLRFLRKNTAEYEHNNKVESQDEKFDTSFPCTMLKSVSANPNNILVDTCALASQECLDIIEKADSVTFIYSTLTEMDKKEKEISKLIKRKLPNIKSTHMLLHNIRQYIGKILENPDKFMLSHFSGYPNTNYVDDVLLQYLALLPKQIRPTLLTADKKLSCKALAQGFDYILKMYDENSVLLDNFTLIKSLKLGFLLYEKDNKLYIYYKGTFKCEIIRNGLAMPFKSKQLVPVEIGDEIHLYLLSKGNVTTQSFNIKV